MTNDNETSQTSHPLLQENLSLFTHGPYVVFDDDSTYAWAEDSTIALLTQEGEDHLSEAMDFKAVHDDDVVWVTLRDLIAAYNRVHGTKI